MHGPFYHESRKQHIIKSRSYAWAIVYQENNIYIKNRHQNGGIQTTPIFNLKARSVTATLLKI